MLNFGPVVDLDRTLMTYLDSVCVLDSPDCQQIDMIRAIAVPFPGSALLPLSVSVLSSRACSAFGLNVYVYLLDRH